METENLSLESIQNLQSKVGNIETQIKLVISCLDQKDLLYSGIDGALDAISNLKDLIIEMSNDAEDLPNELAQKAIVSKLDNLKKYIYQGEAILKVCQNNLRDPFSNTHLKTALEGAVSLFEKVCDQLQNVFVILATAIHGRYTYTPEDDFPPAVDNFLDLLEHNSMEFSDLAIMLIDLVVNTSLEMPENLDP